MIELDHLKLVKTRWANAILDSSKPFGGLHSVNLAQVWRVLYCPIDCFEFKQAIVLN